jgi:hypothetical protein
MDNKPQTTTIIILFAGLLIFLALGNMDLEGQGTAFAEVVMFVIAHAKDFAALFGIALLAVGVYYAIDAVGQFQKILEDARYVNAIDYFLNWTDGIDNASKKALEEGYLKNKKHCICFGILYDGTRTQGSFLSFSDDKPEHNLIGKRFQEGKEGIERYFCQFTYDELANKVPLGMPGPKGELIQPSGELFDRQKTRQTCAERKVVAKLVDLYGLQVQIPETESAVLVLLTNFEPCTNCSSMIRDINERCGDKFQIQSIYVDLIGYILQEKDSLLRIKKGYEQSIASYQKFYKLFVKRTPAMVPTEKQKAKQEEQAIKMLRSTAIKIGKAMAQGEYGDFEIKRILKCFVNSNSKTQGITEEQIDQLYKTIIEPQIKKRK